MTDALHSGDSFYRMLFENAGDAIFVHNENMILAVNKKACEMLGYTEDELLAMRPNEVDAPEQRMCMPEHTAKLKNRKPITFETLHQKKDGTRFFVEVTANLITLNGEPAVISICRDNTIREYYDKLLRDTTIEWQNTFDAINGAVFLLSPKHKILRCNKASYILFNNFKQGEILGKYCCEVVHGTSNPIPECPLTLMKKTKKRETAVLKSGECWLEVTADPVLDEDNNVSAVVHVVSDITERKRAEEALQDAMDFSQLLLNTSPAFIVAIGFDGKTIMMNKSMLSTLGYAEEEIRGLDYVQTFVPEENREMLNGVFQEIIRNGKAVVVENLIVGKSGQRLLVEWNGRPGVNTKKGIPFFVGVGTDITESKRIRL
jgi:PAS domain S-box-containing protein